MSDNRRLATAGATVLAAVIGVSSFISPVASIAIDIFSPAGPQPVATRGGEFVTVESATPKDEAEWKGVSGAALFWGAHLLLASRIQAEFINASLAIHVYRYKTFLGVSNVSFVSL